MRGRWVRASAVTAGALLAVALVPGTAQAATGTVSDSRGDAPKVADITKLRVANGEHRVTGVLTVPQRNKKKHAATDLIIKTKDSGRHKYIVSIARNRKGKVTGKFLGWQRGDDPSTYKTLPCAGIETSWSGTKTTISVPVSCLTKTTARKIKAKAAILARVGPGHDSYDERFTPFIKRG
jgi:hypothetical protein